MFRRVEDKSEHITVPLCGCKVPPDRIDSTRLKNGRSRKNSVKDERLSGMWNGFLGRGRIFLGGDLGKRHDRTL